MTGLFIRICNLKRGPDAPSAVEKHRIKRDTLTGVSF
jgi:hypothetical protein